MSPVVTMPFEQLASVACYFVVVGERYAHCHRDRHQKRCVVSGDVDILSASSMVNWTHPVIEVNWNFLCRLPHFWSRHHGGVEDCLETNGPWGDEMRRNEGNSNTKIAIE